MCNSIEREKNRTEMAFKSTCNLYVFLYFRFKFSDGLPAK